MNAKLLLVIGFVLLLGVGAVLVLIFTSGGPGREPPPSGSLPIIGGGTPTGPGAEPTPLPTPGAAERDILEVVPRDVVGATLGPDGISLRYIARENGHVYASDLAGDHETSLSNLTILEAFEASWPKPKNRVAVRYHDAGAVKTFLHGLATNTPGRFLPPETTSLDWSPDGTALAYLARRGETVSLTTADAAHQNPRVVFSTPVPDFTLRWIQTNVILFVSRPSGLAPSLVMAFDVTQRSAAPLGSSSHGLVLTPSADGGALLLSASDERGAAQPLTLRRTADGSSRSIAVTTIADKCAFAPNGATLYCGVPRQPIPAPSPDGWYKGAVSFSDRIIAVDLQSGIQTVLMEDAADVDVVSPFPSPDGQYLFFQNKKSGAVWRLSIEPRR